LGRFRGFDLEAVDEAGQPRPETRFIESGVPGQRLTGRGL
jgi:hypothetical protein